MISKTFRLNHFKRFEVENQSLDINPAEVLQHEVKQADQFNSMSERCKAKIPP